MITRLIQTLNSPEIAIDDRHTPRLHARFLAGLLSRHRRDVATSGRLHPPPPPPNQTVGMGGGAGQTLGGGGAYSQPAGTQQVFSVAPSHNQSQSPMQQQQQMQQQGQQQQQMQGVVETRTMPTAVEPVYHQEAAYTADIGPLEVLDFSPDGSIDDEIFGGPLLALKNPNYWDNMMMPGYVFLVRDGLYVVR